MGYDRYERRDDERGYRDDRQRDYRSGGEREERGFFDRAIDSVSNFFSDDDSGGGRRDEQRDPYRSSGGYDPRAFDRDEDDRSGRSAFFGGGQSRGGDRSREDEYRSPYGRGSGESGGFGQSDYGRDRQPSYDRQSQEGRSRGYQSQGSDRYRPLTGDYGRGSGEGGRQGSGFGGQDFGQQQYGRQERFQDQQNERSQPSFAKSPHDQHYSSWRQRQIEELDRDYDEYCREHQSRFENEFSSFRTQRQTKRQMLGQIREHAEVVDESGQHVGTVDKVRGEKVILTKNDPEAGGVHRSFTCALLDRVEDGKVYLAGTKDSIRSRLTEEREDDRQGGSQGGGMLSGIFGKDQDREPQRSTNQPTGQSLERPSGEQQGEGPHVLDQSFSGTYDEQPTGKKTR